MDNIGVNVIEVPGSATPSVRAAPTSVAAFVIRARRGALGAVRLVTSWSQFVDHFGDVEVDDGTPYGPWAVRGFFENGGSVAYVTRVGAELAKAASLEIAPGASLAAGWRGAADPGAWGNAISVRIKHEGTSAFSLTLTLARPGLGDVVERWGGLTAADAMKRLNDSTTGSKLVRLVGALAGQPPELPDDATPAPTLAGGADGTFGAGELDGACGEALRLFDATPVQLLACPESASDGLAVQAAGYCEQRGDCMFVGYVVAADVGAAGTNSTVASSYAALYFPLIRAAARAGSRWVPPVGHVLGVYARTDAERGVWKAPAGTAARVLGALETSANFTDVDHTLLVKERRVNAVRALAGQGVVIDSARTRSTDARWLFVNVRLLFNFVKSSLKEGLRWAVHEPNDETLWGKVRYNSITPFLAGLWRRGAFGPGDAKDVFTVQVDRGNNPADSVQQGVLNVDVTFYPSRPAETIVVRVGQQEGGGTASEA